MDDMELDIEEYPDNTGEAKGAAEKAGMTVIVADDLTLCLDLDTAADLAQWEKAKPRLSDIGVEPIKVETWASKSGNTHVLIRMKKPLPILHRIGLQAALGSDRKREFMAYRDVANGYEFPVMLFRPKAVA